MQSIVKQPSSVISSTINYIQNNGARGWPGRKPEGGGRGGQGAPQYAGGDRVQTLHTHRRRAGGGGPRVRRQPPPDAQTCRGGELTMNNHKCRKLLNM